jgi:hypothetical protein
MPHDFLEQSLSLRPQRHRDQTAIRFFSIPAHITVFLQSIDEFYNAVMFERYAFRESPDRGHFAQRQPSDSQEH